MLWERSTYLGSVTMRDARLPMLARSLDEPELAARTTYGNAHQLKTLQIRKFRIQRGSRNSPRMHARNSPRTRRHTLRTLFAIGGHLTAVALTATTKLAN